MSKATEKFWAGEFGDQYQKRNRVDWKKKMPFFRQMIRMTGMTSVLEVGCGPGWNLRAIDQVSGMSVGVAGCDINETAIKQAQRALPMADFDIMPATAIEETYADAYFDLVMTAGLLIHVPPSEIKEVMRQIAALSDHYVLAIEYASLKEEEIDYRGHAGRLWRRPYGAMYADLGLNIEYCAPLGPEQGFGEGCMAWLLRKMP